MGLKGDRTREHVIKTAIQCLARQGDKNTTFQSIAESSGMSQALVVKYLKTRDNVFYEVIDYLLEWSRIETEAGLSLEEAADKKLCAYFQVSLRLFRANPDIGKIYSLLFHRSGFDPESRDRLLILRREATKRIHDILKQGVRQKTFKVQNLVTASKVIHSNLVGMLLCAAA